MRRTAVLVAIALVAVAGLAACSKGPSDPMPPDDNMLIAPADSLSR
jgi:predicted small lipoprotein YifL